MDGAKCCWNLAHGRKVVGTIRSLVNARTLQLDYAKVLHVALFIPILLHGSKEDRSRIRAVKMENLTGSLNIRRIDRVLNAWQESYME